MAFVRRQKRGSGSYFYLVESRRENNKVRQINLKYLGTSEPSKERVQKIIEEIKAKNNNR